MSMHDCITEPMKRAAPKIWNEAGQMFDTSLASLQSAVPFWCLIFETPVYY